MPPSEALKPLSSGRISLAQCALLARQAGLQIWRRYGVPVYFYGASAARPDRVQLEDVRRGQFEGLREAYPNLMMSARSRRADRARNKTVPTRLRHYTGRLNTYD